MTAHSPIRRARHQWTEEPPVAEHTPTFRLQEFIDEHRAHVGEAKWAELQREWRP